MRFLRAAIDAHSDEHIETIRSEVNFFRYVSLPKYSLPLLTLTASSVINGVGESVPHARTYIFVSLVVCALISSARLVFSDHYERLLNDYLAQTCGKQYATPLAAPTLPRRNPNTHVASDLSHTFDFGLSATATVMADGGFLS